MTGRPIRVARLISFMAVGGVQNMLVNTLPLFDRERFDLRVVCTYRRGELADRLESAGIPVECVPVKGRLSPVGLWRLSRWLRRHRIDIVHTHMYASNVTGTVAARLAGVPVKVCHVHAAHEWRTASRGRMERGLDRWRTHYLAVSGAVRTAFVEHAGFDPGARMDVLHNAVRPLARDPGARARIRAELGIPPGAPVIGTVARLVPVKGLDLLVGAMARVAGAVPEARLVIVGRGREREALARQAAELGLGERVILTGERTDVEALYEAFDVFALSSRSEGFGNVLLEALTFGLPVVAARVGGIPELLEDGRSGLLVDPGSAEALAAGLLRVLESPELAGRLRAGARARVAEFSREAYVERLSALYERLLGRSDQAP